MPGSRLSGSQDTLRLESAGRVDVAPLLPVDVASLPRGLHARCVAFHPTRPLLAVGVATCIGGYDLVSGVRQGRVDVKSPPIALMFSRDGSLLVVATAEWHIFGISTSTWRLRVLAPMNELRSSPLEHILMAVTGGMRPLVFFTRVGKDSIRMAVTPGAGAEKKSADRKLKWGIKLKLDSSKTVVGLVAHPTSSQLLVLYDDAALKSYTMSSNGLQSAWGASYILPGDVSVMSRLVMTQNPLQVLPHPFTEGGCLLAVGVGCPSMILLELVAKVEPQVVHRAAMPDHMPLLGLGLLQSQAVLFAFTTTPDGQLKVLAWQTSNTPKGVTCSPIRVEVPALDDDPAALAAATGGSGVKNGGGAAGGPSSWHQLWGAGAYQGVLPNAAAGSFLLDKLLAPVVQSAVLHPTLGCVAVQRAPPPALRQAANIMQQRLGLISAPEAVISRRTASVPLLSLLRPSLASAAWPGGRVAPMHTDVAFWQPAAGLGPATLQFPCHLYFLSPGKLSKYSLASKKSGCFVSLPPIDASGIPHEPKQLVHSARQHAWLVFFESKPPVGPGAAAAAAAAAADGSGGGGGGRSHFTLVQDAAAAGQATWFLPGRTGVFLGPQDLYFAILANSGSTVSVYRTPGFKGKSHALYTISLAKPSSFGCGLLPGPAALAAPRVGAEAAARAAREAEEAADKAAKDAADAEAAAAEQAAAADAEGGAGGDGDGAADGSAAGAGPSAAAAAAAAVPVSQSAKLHIRRPGETWRPTNDSDDESAGGDMMVPVLGIGPAFQGPVGKGLAAKHTGKKQGLEHGRLGFVDHAEEEEEEAGERHSGGGVVMWHAAGDRLVMAGLPAAGVQYAVGDHSDDPDAADAGDNAAPDMGQVFAEHSLQLQPQERVVTVVWQNTQQGPPLEPYQAAAAILTTQRLLLVSGELCVLASLDASCGSVGLASGITSLLWVGPALLFMTAAGQVMQLTWTGQVQHMASVAANPPPLLAGALADSLLLVRPNSTTGEPEVTSRAVGILQPLVLGWTSLASSGLLPKGLNTARAALQSLLEAFDASNVTSGMLWSLIQGWCGDVAAALAAHATDVEPSVQLAANSAAGRWSAVVSSLRGEHEHSVYYPAPAPQGSQLHHKLLAAAAGAIMHGQFGAAQECLEAAGEWETLMAVCVCCGDFGALRSLAAGLKSGAASAAGGDQEASDIARLARALVAAYERGGRAFALNRIVGGSNNWRLRAKMADDSFFSNAADWSFGAAGKLPVMETSSFNTPAAFVQEGDVGPLPRADTTTLGAYLGNADLTAIGDAAALAAAAAGEALPPGRAAGLPGAASGEADFLANLDNLVALSSRAGDSASKGNIRRSSTTSSIDSDLEGDAAAAAAAGAAGTSAAGVRPAAAAQRDPFSFSDEDDEDDGTSFGYKFKIHIKAREDGDNPAAAGATGASAADLRVAASKLKSLGPPGTPTAAAFKEQLGSKQGKQGPAAAAGRGPPGEDMYDLSFLAGKPLGAGSPTPPAAAAAGAGSSSSGLPPRAPSSSGAAAAAAGAAALAAKRQDSFDAIGEMAGIRSSGGGLGGPAMRPKPKAQQAAPISDEDFFAALAPAIVPGGVQQQQQQQQGGGRPSAVAAPTAAAAQQQQQRQQSLGVRSSGVSGFDDDAFAGGGGIGAAAASARAPAPAPAAAARASVVEDFFADFGGTSSSSAALQPPPTLTPPQPPPPAAAAAAAAGSTSRALQPPPRPAPPAAAAAAAAAAGPTGGGDATALYMQGVAAMESASWEAATTAFAGALSALSAEAPSSSRSERTSFAAQYLAAVMLLGAAGADSAAKGARLYRYAAALKLDDRHRVALVKEAVIRNKHAGNFRYAADQLTWLVTRSLGSTPMDIMAKLQEDIDECDRKGGRNASIDADENIEDWVSLVAAGASRQDVEEVVLPLLQQA